MTTQFFNVGIHQFAYTVYGSGPLLMLIHGYTESKEIWFDFAVKLGKSYTVLMPDLPGHGESDLPDNLSMDVMADMLNNLVLHVGCKEVVLVGHSMGGYVGACFADKYFQKVKGLGFFHSSARADSAEGKENRMRICSVIDAGHADFLNSFIEGLFFEENRKSLRNEIEQLKSRALRISAPTLIACQVAMAERQGYIELLTSSDFPFLFIAGKQDARVDFQSVMAQASLTKRALILTLGNCGHMGYLEAPGETYLALENFVKMCYQ